MLILPLLGVTDSRIFRLAGDLKLLGGVINCSRLGVLLMGEPKIFLLEGEFVGIGEDFWGVLWISLIGDRIKSFLGEFHNPFIGDASTGLVGENVNALAGFLVALCGPSGVIKAFLSGEKFNALAGPTGCKGCGDFTGVGMFSFAGDLNGSFSEFSFSATIFLDLDFFDLDD